MDDFETPQWRAVREHNGLRGFDDVWKLGGDWVEPPNHRHGGFGAVTRRELPRPGGGRSAYFIKVHRNRLRRSALRPWTRRPALERELANHRRCADAGVASPPPLYCANRSVDGEHRGILVTEELAAHRSLASVLAAWRVAGRPPPGQRRRLIAAIAARLRALHAAGLAVRSFTPQHIYVRESAWGGADAVQLIDLERIKPTPFRGRARIADLVTLVRATPGVGRTDRLRFLIAYLGDTRLTPAGRRLWRRVDRAVAEKQAKRRAELARRAQSSDQGR